MAKDTIDTSLNAAFKLHKAIAPEGQRVDFSAFSSFWLPLEQDEQEHWINAKRAELDKIQAEAAAASKQGEADEKMGLVGNVQKKNVVDEHKFRKKKSTHLE